MRTSYYDWNTRSMIDLARPGTHFLGGWTITRVSVLPPHRGKGLARMLMNQVLSDADRTRNNLWLEIAPSRDYQGALSFQQLFDFYWRCGFRPHTQFPIMMRSPYSPPAWTIDQAVARIFEVENPDG